MIGAVQVVLVRLLWENSAISTAGHNENLRFSCLTAPCELGSFSTDTDTGPLLIPPMGLSLLACFHPDYHGKRGENGDCYEPSTAGMTYLLPTSQSPERPQLSLLAPL